MTHNRSIDAARDPWRASLRHSRERRAAAHRARRWMVRRRGVTVCACAAMALGGGVALAANGGSSAGASDQNAGDGPASLAPGDSGGGVKQLQRKLGLTADGVYGSITKRAVKRFQRRSGLKADGVAGPTTLSALGIQVATGYAAGAGSGESGSSVPAKLQRIAQCESGGNLRAVSADGTYRGKYQFDLPTWRDYGGSGDPIDASEATQDQVATKLYGARGSAAWGACANS